MFGLLIQCIKSFGLQGIWIYIQLKTGSTRSIRIPGIKFPITMRSLKSDKISFKEIFMKREYDITLPPETNPKIIIDGGANIGFTSVFFANQYPQARIFTIEPDENNFQLVLQNVKPYPNITPVKSALWYKEELINVVDKGYGERGFMIEKNETSNSLQATSIHQLMKKYSLTQIDILKMDIEGSEKEVFSVGYENWLPLTKCLVIELHDRMKPGCSHAVFSAITKYDFSFSIKGENLVFINNSLR
jgi:FkbM family methyltransferase